MSRIGKLPIQVPKNVQIEIKEGLFKASGRHGELTQEIPKEISVEIESGLIVLKKQISNKKAQQKYGLIRSLINNIVIGVSEKFEKKLIMVGVGYRAQVQGKKLILQAGYSHPVEFSISDGLEVKVEGNTNLTISGINKHDVGLFASRVRSTRLPEPYKGKGIRYNDEIILRKAGKSGK